MPTESRTRRRETPEIRETQLLDAAESVLLQSGLQAATMADIATRAGVAKGTVYLYFDSKQALLAALRRRYVAAIEDQVRAAIASSPSARRTSAAVVALVTAGSERPDLHHVLFQEAGSEDDAFAPIIALLAEVVEPKLDGVRADFVMGGVHAAMVHAAHLPKSKRAAVAAETATLVAALGSGGAGKRR